MSAAVNPCNLSISFQSVCHRILLLENFHGRAIKKSSEKKRTNATDKAELERIFNVMITIIFEVLDTYL